VRPETGSFLDVSIEKPYEIHLIRFDKESGFKSFMTDKERKKYLHLKEQAIRESFLIKGEKL